MRKNETIAWLGLREIYKLLGSEDGATIIKLLLQKEGTRTGELIDKSGIQPPKFHSIMKALVMCQVVEKVVHQDRSVTYSISTFGKNILELSEPILETISDTFKNEDSMLLTVINR